MSTWDCLTTSVRAMDAMDLVNCQSTLSRFLDYLEPLAGFTIVAWILGFIWWTADVWWRRQ